MLHERLSLIGQWPLSCFKFASETMGRMAINHGHSALYGHSARHFNDDHSTSKWWAEWPQSPRDVRLHMHVRNLRPNFESPALSPLILHLPISPTFSSLHLLVSASPPVEVLYDPGLQRPQTVAPAIIETFRGIEKRIFCHCCRLQLSIISVFSLTCVHDISMNMQENSAKARQHLSNWYKNHHSEMTDLLKNHMQWQNYARSIGIMIFLSSECPSRNRETSERRRSVPTAWPIWIERLSHLGYKVHRSNHLFYHWYRLSDFMTVIELSVISYANKRCAPAEPL